MLAWLSLILLLIPAASLADDGIIRDYAGEKEVVIWRDKAAIRRCYAGWTGDNEPIPSELRKCGETSIVVAVTSGTAATLVDEGDLDLGSGLSCCKRVRVTDGPNKGSEGWILNRLFKTNEQIKLRPKIVEACESICEMMHGAEGRQSVNLCKHGCAE